MKFFLIDSQRLQNALQFLTGVPVGEGFICEIKKGNRSLNQNALWHKWIDMIAKEAGTHPEERLMMGTEQFAMEYFNMRLPTPYDLGMKD